MTAGEGRRSRADDTEADKPPLYARVLRLENIRPGPWWCFLFFEGALAVAGVLVLADWVSPWGLLVLPFGVAVAVKLNDVVTGALPLVAAPKARSTTSAESDAGDTPTAGKHTADTETPENETPGYVGSDNGHAAAGNTSSGPSESGHNTVADVSLFDSGTAEDKVAAAKAMQERAAEEKLRDKLAADRAAAEKSADDRAQVGKSDRGMRGRRSPFKTTSARSRRIAGGKTTAPTRSGSTPRKDEG